MWLHIPVNPDPWAIGPLGVGKRGGKYFPYVGANAQLVAFKEAVAESLREQGVGMVDIANYRITFYFFRRLDSHSRGRKHQADATNLQKATEDALQDVLFGNDRDVHDVRSVIVEQSDAAPGAILINLEPRTFEDADIPEEMWDKVRETEMPTLFDNNQWGGPVL